MPVAVRGSPCACAGFAIYIFFSTSCLDGRGRVCQGTSIMKRFLLDICEDVWDTARRAARGAREISDSRSRVSLSCGCGVIVELLHENCYTVEMAYNRLCYTSIKELLSFSHISNYHLDDKVCAALTCRRPLSKARAHFFQLLVTSNNWS